MAGFNWRKSVIQLFLNVSGSDVVSRLNFIKEFSRRNHQEIHNEQKNITHSILLHSYKNVPYYKRILTESGVVEDGEKIRMEYFNNIPFLTKDIISNNFENLKSADLGNRKWFLNTSGGSTGEPVKFIQDSNYKNGDIAETLFFFYLAGKDIGEKEIKLWGSERDIIEGSESLKERVKNRLYNRLLLNSFRMSESDIELYIKKWNKFKPKVVWSYIDSIYEFARYAKEKSIELSSPEAVIVTAGTCYDWMKKTIEETLLTKVLNQYGSREVGGIASECTFQSGLHIFEWRVLIEIVDENGNVCPPGKEGEIIVTSLENYAMPLIRYKIGDIGAIKENEMCPCGWNLSKLEKVTGRITNHFIIKNGTLIHGEYFTHLFYYRKWIRKFKVIQKGYDSIQVLIVPNAEKVESDISDIKKKIQLVMGEKCKVDFQYVDDIKPQKSGKFLFTESELYNLHAGAAPTNNKNGL